MIDLRTDLPVKEELTKRLDCIHAQIRDLLIEEEQVLRLAYDKKTLLTKEEVSKRLRCPADKIPRNIPRMRIGKNWLFESGDVDAFIESKKRKV